MLCEGSAIAGREHQRGRTHGISGISEDIHRALNVVSTAFVGGFFPFPSFNFAFCSAEYQRISDASTVAKKYITEKSATFSFFFFELFGMVRVADQECFDHEL